MSIRVLFFGSLAERMGARERLVEAPRGGLTLSELKGLLTSGDAEAADVLAPPVRAAVDREVASGDPRIRPGQEVAFFPIFSGG